MMDASNDILSIANHASKPITCERATNNRIISHRKYGFRIAPIDPVRIKSEGKDAEDDITDWMRVLRIDGDHDDEVALDTAAVNTNDISCFDPDSEHEYSERNGDEV